MKKKIKKVQTLAVTEKHDEIDRRVYDKAWNYC